MTEQHPEKHKNIFLQYGAVFVQRFIAGIFTFMAFVWLSLSTTVLLIGIFSCLCPWRYVIKFDRFAASIASKIAVTNQELINTVSRLLR